MKFKRVKNWRLFMSEDNTLGNYITVNAVDMNGEWNTFSDKTNVKCVTGKLTMDFRSDK